MSDITGQALKHWTVLSRVPSARPKASQWLCRCVGGTTKVLHRHNLVSGRTTSCGCKAPGLAERFWSKVSVAGPNDCWSWLGTTSKSGYGRLFGGRHSGKQSTHTASRLSYELNCGPIPDGLEILHSCDNPRCVNPRHLRVGSHKENMSEASERQRFKNHVKGRAHHNAKLSAAKVKAIRRRHARGESSRALAVLYGVAKPTMYNVLHGRTWKHVR